MITRSLYLFQTEHYRFHFDENETWRKQVLLMLEVLTNFSSPISLKAHYNYDSLEWRNLLFSFNIKICRWKFYFLGNVIVDESLSQFSFEKKFEERCCGIGWIQYILVKTGWFHFWKKCFNTEESTYILFTSLTILK